MNADFTPYPDPPSIDEIERVLAQKKGSQSEPYMLFIGPGAKKNSVSFYMTYNGEVFVLQKRTNPANNCIVLQCHMARTHKCKEWLTWTYATYYMGY